MYLNVNKTPPFPRKIKLWHKELLFIKLLQEDYACIKRNLNSRFSYCTTEKSGTRQVLENSHLLKKSHPKLKSNTHTLIYYSSAGNPSIHHSGVTLFTLVPLRARRVPDFLTEMATVCVVTVEIQASIIFLGHALNCITCCKIAKIKVI